VHELTFVKAKMHNGSYIYCAYDMHMDILLTDHVDQCLDVLIWAALCDRKGDRLADFPGIVDVSCDMMAYRSLASDMFATSSWF